MDALSAVLQVDLRLKLEPFGGQTNRNQNRLCLGEVDGRIVKAGSQSRMNNFFDLFGLFIFGLVARLTMNRLISQLESQFLTDYFPNVFGQVNGGCLAFRVGSLEHNAHTTSASLDNTCRINRFHVKTKFDKKLNFNDYCNKNVIYDCLTINKHLYKI